MKCEDGVNLAKCEQNRDDYMDEDDLQAERAYLIRREIERRIANEKLSHKNTEERTDHD